MVARQQLTGIPDTTAQAGQTFDYFVPMTTIFGDGQTLPSNLIYTATTAGGQDLATVGLSFSFTVDPTTLVGTGEFKTLPPDPLGPDGVANTGDEVSGTLDTPGQIAVRVTATDTGPACRCRSPTRSSSMCCRSTRRRSRTTMPTPSSRTRPSPSRRPTQGVLANDTDADFGDRLTAKLVSGPAHGTLQFHTDGTFVYKPTLNYAGNDSFTYMANDIFLTSSNVATVSLTVKPRPTR